MESRNFGLGGIERTNNLGDGKSQLEELGGRLLSDKSSREALDGNYQQVFSTKEYENMVVTAIAGLMDRHDYKHAELVLKNFLIYNEKIHGKNSKEVGAVLNLLGVACQLDGRSADAEKYFRKGFAICRIAYGNEHILTGRVCARLANSIAQQGRNSESVPYFEEALRICRKNNPMSNPEAGSTMLNTITDYLPVLNVLGKYKEARQLAAEGNKIAFAIFEKVKKPIIPSGKVIEV